MKDSVLDHLFLIFFVANDKKKHELVFLFRGIGLHKCYLYINEYFNFQEFFSKEINPNRHYQIQI